MPAARPRLPRLIAVSCAAALGLGVLAGCSSEPDVSKTTFAEDLAERTGRSDAVAQCLTDAIWEEFEDQNDRNRIYRAASDQELTDDERETLKGINEACLAEDATAPTQPAEEGE